MKTFLYYCSYYLSNSYFRLIIIYLTLPLLVFAQHEHPLIPFNKGMDALYDGQHQQAIEYFTQVIDLNKEHLADAYNYRAVAYGSINKMQEALIDHGKAIAENSGKAAYYSHRGRTYYLMKKYEQAIKDQTYALVLDNRHEQAYAYRGAASYHLARYPEALADFEMALKLNPNNVSVSQNLQNTKAELGTNLEQKRLTTPPYSDLSKQLEKEVVKYQTLDMTKKVSGKGKKTEGSVDPKTVFRSSKKEIAKKTTPQTTKKKKTPPSATKPNKNIPSEQKSYKKQKTQVSNTKSLDKKQKAQVSTTKPNERNRRPQKTKKQKKQDLPEQQTTTQNIQNVPQSNRISDKIVKVSDPPKKEKSPVSKPLTSPPSRLDIIWLSPDLDELGTKNFLAKSDQILIKLKILTTLPITKNQVSVYLNNQLYEPKFGEVQLRGHTQSFTFSRTIQLEETPSQLNLIYVKIQHPQVTRTSNLLKVSYSPEKPNLHILSVGTEPVNLQYTGKDAKDFANIFRSQSKGKNKLFNEVNIKTLTGNKATAQEIEGMLEDYHHAAIHPKDVMLVFISAHGFLHKEQFRIQGSDYNPRRKMTTSVAYNDITEQLDNIECKKLIFIDACQSGGAKDDALAFSLNQAIRTLSQHQNGIITIASSQENQLSWEDKRWENGAFTEAIIAGLQKGRADNNKDKIITVKELYQYLLVRVPPMVKAAKNAIQIPYMTKNELGDLPIYSKK